jgi:hypothetical protein
MEPSASGPLMTSPVLSLSSSCLYRLNAVSGRARSVHQPHLIQTRSVCMFFSKAAFACKFVVCAFFLQPLTLSFRVIHTQLQFEIEACELEAHWLSQFDFHKFNSSETEQ